LDIEVLKTFGQVAGLAGISIGVLLIVFRDILKKKIFANLTKSQSFRLIALMTVLTWSIAVLGIGAWVYSETQAKGPVTDTGIANSGNLTIKGDLNISRKGSDDK